jgi:fatty acid desaturase
MKTAALLRHSIEWKDLRTLTSRQVVQELLLPVPWLAGSLTAAAHEWYVLALPCSFMFFLTGLRQVHGAFHYSIGVTRRGAELVMGVLSTLMLGSMHAVQINHLRHHVHCMDDDDVEAMSARMPIWKALATGPLFPVRLHATAFRLATPRQRRWIVLELVGCAVVVAVAIGSGIGVFRYHVLAMTVGQCLTSFFAVWTVHHDCDANGIFARTIRGGLKGWLTYDMFYHLEHHLFPAVPTTRLPELARRLDAADPEWSAKRVF